MSVTSISLADTVGLASPQMVAEVAGLVKQKYDYLDIGVHLHGRPEDAGDKIAAAYNAGVRRFDSAIGGLGGCPFAQDSLVGNLPTEKVLETLAQLGAEPPIRKPLDSVIRINADIALKYGAKAPAADSR
jgi:hydroxymethylglutaryl-CoA lyase